MGRFIAKFCPLLHPTMNNFEIKNLSLLFNTDCKQLLSPVSGNTVISVSVIQSSLTLNSYIEVVISVAATQYLPIIFIVSFSLWYTRKIPQSIGILHGENLNLLQPCKGARGNCKTCCKFRMGLILRCDNDAC